MQAVSAEELPTDGTTPSAPVVDENDTAPATPAEDAASMPVDDPEAAPIGARNFSSHLSGVKAGFQSRRWKDESYSQVLFTGCWAGTGSPGGRHYSTLVDLRHDISGQPDRSWGLKKYTNCFKGDNKTSNGQWSNLSNGNHFFQIKEIGGFDDSPYIQLGVKKVFVDTSKAD
ncbi:hypothetical protein SMD44_p20059 (plasmid) [Streptomyces alboflavus]|uniref:Uncharacterized protein n=1 Tax=Streptomyces alboflavus TaxID=67267 RepID=A0A291W5M5_9ACTN|nr:hypothetical protein [Streptomyces alboflavus]ATM24842.1 hypothetical protein SMD44_p20059 [Streptomyces alboflavus]